jgi:hypothetical protein
MNTTSHLLAAVALMASSPSCSVPPWPTSATVP